LLDPVIDGAPTDAQALRNIFDIVPISGTVIAVIGGIITAIIAATATIIAALIGYYALSPKSPQIQDQHPTPTSTITPSLSNTPTPRPISTPSPTPTPKEDTHTPTPPPKSGIIANSKSEWRSLLGVTQWRIKAIQPEEKFTRFYIEIRNTDRQIEGTFISFNYVPLVVIDDSGAFYKMLRISAVPDGVRETSERWYLQAQRVITVAVDFAPLANGTTSGSIKYQDGNIADPATFSFAQ
jgi:hypothetical protein